MRRKTNLGLAGALLAALCAAGSGCGHDDDDPAPPLPSGARFVADEGTGARLWLEVAEEQPDRLLVRVWAAELGSVFGFAAHLTFDSARLELDGDRVAALDLTPWGGPVDSSQLLATLSGDVALGAARRGPGLGDVPIEQPTELASVPLRVLDPASTRLDLGTVIVRRADGSYQPTGALGGTLDTTGGAP